MARNTPKKDEETQTPALTPAPDPNLDLEQGKDADAADNSDDDDSTAEVDAGWSVVNTSPADITLHGAGQFVLIAGANEAHTRIPATIVSALYNSAYFRALFKDGTLRKV